MEFANSYCGICYIWTENDIHHCEGCGCCRIGKRECMFHCNNCEACYNKFNANGDDITCTHVCKKNFKKYKESSCVLCLENLFVKSPAILNCGHFIHYNCYKEYRKYDYRCPCCKKCMCKVNWEKIRSRKRTALSSLSKHNYINFSCGDIVETKYGYLHIKSFIRVSYESETKCHSSEIFDIEALETNDGVDNDDNEYIEDFDDWEESTDDEESIYDDGESIYDNEESIDDGADNKNNEDIESIYISNDKQESLEILEIDSINGHDSSFELNKSFEYVYKGYIICNKLDYKNVSNVFDSEITSNIIYKKIYCYECEKKSITEKWFGELECKLCGCFNTCLDD